MLQEEEEENGEEINFGKDVIMKMKKKKKMKKKMK